MLNFGMKIPFAIRAMFKILLVRARGGSDKDFFDKIEPHSHEIYFLAEIFIAGWLNAGYRNPKCFGIQPSVEKELELEFIFFQAARITFEHVMLMMKMPERNEDPLGYDIKELNKFIESMASQVFIFYTKLVNIDITELLKNNNPEHIESNMLRIDDLELLYVYAQKLYDEKSQKKITDGETYQAY